MGLSGVISNLFIFFTKRFNKHKKNKKHKNNKKHKKNKKHKSQTGDFLSLRHYYAHKMLTFLFLFTCLTFYALHAFLCFLHVKVKIACSVWLFMLFILIMRMKCWLFCLLIYSFNVFMLLMLFMLFMPFASKSEDCLVFNVFCFLFFSHVKVKTAWHLMICAFYSFYAFCAYKIFS